MINPDGVLIKTWEVHCRACQEPYLGIRGDMSQAQAELRKMGWRTRGGRWVCAVCEPGVPIGHRWTDEP
ncbi:hypothetical protein CcrKarma_gp040 [Caulobacter virus Karma]|uniref:hypothetical protein n=1 Tax=Caulobacter virus Karma TaxID=1211641 RepID=UPI00028B476C|nr:hypothetical protein CcrKarma_gp040 [Caulobacter virus Karma]AFU87557.1 hypothetical protein CcrKarma_gp040 [Caulobacter virus Karma]ARB14256.1 hypothetical protein Ccr5_gp038 [Caulobacter phage Ccr5]